MAPVFFISGAFQNMLSWQRYANDFLSLGIPVILADLPGTGMADLLPSDHGLDFLSSTINQILDDLDCSKACIISASYGTPIGYYFAQHYPDRVQNMVLAGTMKEIPAKLRHGVAHTLLSLREGLMEQFAKEVIGVSGPQKGNGLLCTDLSKPIARRDLAYRLLFSQLASMTMEEQQKYEYNTLRLLHHEPLDLTRPPQCKTLVFTGEYDVFTRPQHCRAIASSIPGSIFTTIKNADHLFHIEQHTVVSDLLLCFSQGVSLQNINGINCIEMESGEGGVHSLSLLAAA